MSVRIFVADDHDIVREGVKSLLRSRPVGLFAARRRMAMTRSPAYVTFSQKPQSSISACGSKRAGGYKTSSTNEP